MLLCHHASSSAIPRGMWHLGMVAVLPPQLTQCRTLRITDQRGCFGTAFLPKIQ